MLSTRRTVIKLRYVDTPARVAVRSTSSYNGMVLPLHDHACIGMPSFTLYRHTSTGHRSVIIRMHGATAPRLCICKSSIKPWSYNRIIIIMRMHTRYSNMKSSIDLWSYNCNLIVVVDLGSPIESFLWTKTKKGFSPISTAFPLQTDLHSSSVLFFF